MMYSISYWVKSSNNVSGYRSWLPNLTKKEMEEQKKDLESRESITNIEVFEHKRITDEIKKLRDRIA